MKKILLYPLFTPLVMVLLCSLSLNIFYTVFTLSIPEIAMDGHLIDIITYVSYSLLIVALIFSYKNFKDKKLDYFAYFFLAISAFLREMGIQHWLASKDTTAIKIKFFTNPNNPISEKILTAVLVLAVLVVIIYITKKYAIHLIKGVFKMDTISWSVGTLVFFGLFSKFIDRYPSNFKRSHGVVIAEAIKNNLSILEETSEVFIPLTAILILIQYYFMIKEEK